MSNTVDKPMVQIKWHDAKFCPDQHSEESALEHSMDEFHSLGYLLKQTKLTTYIASECNDRCEYRNITLIPSGSVISIHNLSIGEPCQL